MTEEENERQKGRLRNSRKDEERGPQGEERSKQKNRKRPTKSSVDKRSQRDSADERSRQQTERRGCWKKVKEGEKNQGETEERDQPQK